MYKFNKKDEGERINKILELNVDKNIIKTTNGFPVLPFLIFPKTNGSLLFILPTLILQTHYNKKRIIKLFFVVV